MKITAAASNPTNPLEAVSHTDPYSYYAGLLQDRPFYRDERLGVWVASSASAVEEVLTNPLAQVRPSAEPVPRYLLDTPLAEIFARLVRMNDGNIHQVMKPAISRTLSQVNLAQVEYLTRKAAHMLLSQPEPHLAGGSLTGFAFQLPVFVLAGLLGIADEQLFEFSDIVGQFVRGLAATTPNSPQIEPGQAAAVFLLDTFIAFLTAPQPGLPTPGPFLGWLIREAQAAGCSDQAVIIANITGFLSQTYDATAGLIGNSLVTLANRPEVRRQVIQDVGLLDNLVQEVLRYDPPIQNTRRFVAAPTTIAGQDLREGETVLVLLAAANRDLSTNSEPASFDLFREKRQIFSFGVGKHSCPGQHLAGVIARVALEALLLAGRIPEALPGPVSYRPSVNARIPIL